MEPATTTTVSSEFPASSSSEEVDPGIPPLSTEMHEPHAATIQDVDSMALGQDIHATQSEAGTPPGSLPGEESDRPPPSSNEPPTTSASQSNDNLFVIYPPYSPALSASSSHHPSVLDDDEQDGPLLPAPPTPPVLLSTLAKLFANTTTTNSITGSQSLPNSPLSYPFKSLPSSPSLPSLNQSLGSPTHSHSNLLLSSTYHSDSATHLLSTSAPSNPSMLPPPSLDTYRSQSLSSQSRRNSTSAATLGPHMDVEKIKDALIKGTRMLKYPNKASSRPEERVIRVQLWPVNQVSWESKKKKAVLSTADLHSIREIRLGQNTKAFEIHGKQRTLEERAFTLIYVSPSGSYKFLNLVAPTKEECAMWVTGLHILLSQVGSGRAGVPGLPSVPVYELSNMNSWLHRMWAETVASRNGGAGLGFTGTISEAALTCAYQIPEGLLDVDGVAALMKKLNLRLSKQEIKSAFKQADISKKGSCTWPPHQILEVYKRYSHPDPSPQPHMDMDHFTAFLLSTKNSPLYKPHTRQVYMDMTRPLSEYLISSSHNTYLLGDQVTGECSVEGFIRALQRGCRCLEIDCFDGPPPFPSSPSPSPPLPSTTDPKNETTTGGPLVYHKNSLTKSIFLWDVLQAIHRYAFVASSYPLILSLELRCNRETQDVIAWMLVEVFRGALVRADEDGEGGVGKGVLPSPEDLRGRVVVKAKVAPGGILAPVFGGVGKGLEREGGVDRSGDTGELGGGDSISAGVMEGAVRDGSLGRPLSAGGGGLKKVKSKKSFSNLTQLLSNAFHSSPNVDPSSDTSTESKYLSPTNSMGVMSPEAYVPNLKSPSTGSGSFKDSFIRRLSSGKIPPSSSSLEATHIGPEANRASEGSVKPKTPLPTGSVKVVISQALANLVVYCKALRFPDFPECEQLSTDYISSWSESKALSFIQSNLLSPSPSRPLNLLPRLRQFTSTHLLRLYPAPVRLNSTNMDPIPLWNLTGAQMVAMNFQTFDWGMQVCAGVFRGNGGCGYILKPRALRPGSSSRLGGTTTTGGAESGGRGRRRGWGDVLELTVVSGQQLPRSSRSLEKEGEGGSGSVAGGWNGAVDAVVEVEVMAVGGVNGVGGVVGSVVETAVGDDERGVTPPVAVVNRVAKYRTRSSGGGGFNALWKDTFRIDLRRWKGKSGSRPNSPSSTLSSAAAATEGVLSDTNKKQESLDKSEPDADDTIILLRFSVLVSSSSSSNGNEKPTPSFSSPPLPSASITSPTLTPIFPSTAATSSSSSSSTPTTSTSAPSTPINAGPSTSNPKDSEVVGVFVVSLDDMEEGYRHIPLYNRRGEQLRFASLFIKVG
ncbi:Phospholipase C [Chytridiales sp. JEL 0842]|nr:Phospholipase C [Chytridiales sp. JEL 0842]